MAYDRGFIKVSWLFGIQNTDEIAVTSLNFSDAAAVGWDEVAALAQIDETLQGPLAQSLMAVLLGNISVRWADYSELRAVRFAAVSAAGVEFDPAKQWDDPTPSEGASPNVLPQASIVLSTRSGSSAGSANFGRMFLPHLTYPLGPNTPRATPAETGPFATAAALFVNGMNTLLDGVVTQSIRATIMTQVIGGTSKTINQVAIGDVVDTQRRRRNQLPELYTFQAIP